MRIDLDRIEWLTPLAKGDVCHQKILKNFLPFRRYGSLGLSDQFVEGLPAEVVAVFLCEHEVRIVDLEELKETHQFPVKRAEFPALLIGQHGFAPLSVLYKLPISELDVPIGDAPPSRQDAWLDAALFPDVDIYSTDACLVFGSVIIDFRENLIISQLICDLDIDPSYIQALVQMSSWTLSGGIAQVLTREVKYLGQGHGSMCFLLAAIIPGEWENPPREGDPGQYHRYLLHQNVSPPTVEKVPYTENTPENETLYVYSNGVAIHRSKTDPNDSWDLKYLVKMPDMILDIDLALDPDEFLETMSTVNPGDHLRGRAYPFWPLGVFGDEQAEESYALTLGYSLFQIPNAAPTFSGDEFYVELSILRRDFPLRQSLLPAAEFDAEWPNGTPLTVYHNYNTKLELKFLSKLMRRPVRGDKYTYLYSENAVIGVHNEKGEVLVLAYTEGYTPVAGSRDQRTLPSGYIQKISYTNGYVAVYLYRGTLEEERHVLLVLDEDLRNILWAKTYAHPPDDMSSGDVHVGEESFPSLDASAPLASVEFSAILPPPLSQSDRVPDLLVAVMITVVASSTMYWLPEDGDPEHWFYGDITLIEGAAAPNAQVTIDNTYTVQVPPSGRWSWTPPPSYSTSGSHTVTAKTTAPIELSDSATYQMAEGFWVDRPRPGRTIQNPSAYVEVLSVPSASLTAKNLSYPSLPTTTLAPDYPGAIIFEGDVPLGGRGDNVLQVTDGVTTETVTVQSDPHFLKLEYPYAPGSITQGSELPARFTGRNYPYADVDIYVNGVLYTQVTADQYGQFYVDVPASSNGLLQVEASDAYGIFATAAVVVQVPLVILYPEEGKTYTTPVSYLSYTYLPDVAVTIQGLPGGDVQDTTDSSGTGFYDLSATPLPPGPAALTVTNGSDTAAVSFVMDVPPPEPAPMSPLDVPGLVCYVLLDLTDAYNMKNINGVTPSVGDTIKTITNLGTLGGDLTEGSLVAGDNTWMGSYLQFNNDWEPSVTLPPSTTLTLNAFGLNRVGGVTGSAAYIGLKRSTSGIITQVTPWYVNTGPAIYALPIADATWINDASKGPDCGAICGEHTAWGFPGDLGFGKTIYSMLPPTPPISSWPEGAVSVTAGFAKITMAGGGGGKMQRAFVGYKAGGLTLEETRAVNAWLRGV